MLQRCVWPGKTGGKRERKRIGKRSKRRKKRMMGEEGESERRMRKECVEKLKGEREREICLSGFELRPEAVLHLCQCR